MAKTLDELKQLKHEYEVFANKLKELTEEELKMVFGGETINFSKDSNDPNYDINIYTFENKDEAKEKFFK